MACQLPASPVSVFAHGTCVTPPHSFFFTDTATTEIYTLSLHDALPISSNGTPRRAKATSATRWRSVSSSSAAWIFAITDRKSTRLNSSHTVISYAVFCLKKKKPAFFTTDGSGAGSVLALNEDEMLHGQQNGVSAPRIACVRLCPWDLCDSAA